MRYRHYRRFHSTPSIGLVILAIVGANLLLRGVRIGGSILIAIVALKFIRWASDPRRPPILDSSSSATTRGWRGDSAAIRQDAAAHGAMIPDDDPTWRGLTALYDKYERARAAYPALGSQYSELIATMWERLRGESGIYQWRDVPRRVLEQWPMPWAGTESDDQLNQSLAKTKRAARQWREAHREAHST